MNPLKKIVHKKIRRKKVQEIHPRKKIVHKKNPRFK